MESPGIDGLETKVSTPSEHARYKEQYARTCVYTQTSSYVTTKLEMKPVDDVLQRREPERNQPISESLGQCARAFLPLRSWAWPMLVDEIHQHPINTVHDQEIRAFRFGVGEEYNRYTAWAARPHRHSNDDDTLDDHLRDAPNVSGQVMAILDDLLESLRDGKVHGSTRLLQSSFAKAK